MKRNLKLIIVLAVLVAVAVVSLAAVNAYSDSKDKKAAKEAAELVLISQDSDDITAIDITDKEGEEYNFSLSGSDWTLTNRDDVNLSSTFCTNLCSYYEHLSASKKVTDTPSDLSIYGLDNPVTLSISDSESTSTIYIGNATSTNDSFYVMKEGSEAVFTMDYSTAYIMSDPAMSMKNTYLTYEWTDNDYAYYKITKQGKTVIELDKSSGIWEAVSPVEHEVNSTNIITYISNISRYELDGYGNKLTDEEYSEYGFDDPYYTFEVKNQDGDTITILVGDSIDSYSDEEIPIWYKEDNQLAYLSYENAYFLERGTEEYISEDLIDLENEDITGGEIILDDSFEVSDIKFSCNYSTENSAFEDVTMNNKSVDMSVSNVSSLFSDFISSLLNMESDSVDAYAEPENTADATVLIETTDGTVKLEFATKESNTYYVFKDGEYTGLIARRKNFSQENGIVDLYQQITEALEIAE